MKVKEEPSEIKDEDCEEKEKPETENGVKQECCDVKQEQNDMKSELHEMKEPSEVQKETEDCIDNKQEDEINSQTVTTATEKSKCDESVSGGSHMLETDKQEDNTEGV